MPRLLLLLALASVASGCEELAPAIDTGSGSSGAGASSTAAGSNGSAPCQGFRDITGVCRSLACLESAPCDPAAPVPCNPGLLGEGVCFAGLCAYPNRAQGCGGPADCPCGLCGADGRCYDDGTGQCGACFAAPAGSSGDGACKACLASCQGTGPLCCAGSGCLCEGQCEGFL